MALWWLKVFVYMATGAAVVAAHGYGGGGYGGYGGMYVPTIIPPPTPKLFGPCARHDSNILTSWRNGEDAPENFEYQVDMVNECDHEIFDAPVKVDPADVIDQEWNADLNKTTGYFHFPGWAKTWGLAGHSTLTFGFISRGRVKVQ